MKQESDQKHSKNVVPLASLSPNNHNWTIKVQVSSKGDLRFYNNQRGSGCVFDVIFTDEEGTQIKAAMFKDVARKLIDVFEDGKVYYVSNGTLKSANKQFNTVKNKYEMLLNDKSQVEEAIGEPAIKTKYNFVPVSSLGDYVAEKDIVDIIGVVHDVSPTMSVKRKSNNALIAKRDITIADDTNQSIVVSLWEDHATNLGGQLFDMADKSPVVALKGVRVQDFRDVSLSTLTQTLFDINPDIPESDKLREWYDSEGKEGVLVSLTSGLISSISSNKSKDESWKNDIALLDKITSDISLGDKKPLLFTIRASMTFIKPDQSFSYHACNTCNKKVTPVDNGYRCVQCNKTEDDCNLRYALSAKFRDGSGEAWLSLFDVEAEKLFGCPAKDLNAMKSKEDGVTFKNQLRKAMWNPNLFRISVTTQTYNNEKRQRITVRDIAPVDIAAETRFLLQEIASMMSELA